jgi:hypothetical protein
VIGVVVEVSGTYESGGYEARVDGAMPFPVGPGGPVYLAAVPAGDHVVSLLAPANCSEADPQPITVTVGHLIRDTVEVTFLVTCSSSFATLRIIARTTGRIPADNYSVWICDGHEYYCAYGGLGSWRLGDVEPNGTLLADVASGLYVVWLRDIPAGCSPQYYGRYATVQSGRTLDVEFQVTCSP